MEQLNKNLDSLSKDIKSIEESQIKFYNKERFNKFVKYDPTKKKDTKKRCFTIDLLSENNLEAANDTCRCHIL